MSVARKAVRGAVWTVLSSIGGRFVSVLGTLALTHFLAPDVVGEVAEATVLAMTAGQLSQIGFGQYLVIHRDLDRGAIFQISALAIGFALVALGTLVAVGVPLALWRGNDSLATYLPPVAATIFIVQLSLLPERMLIREMRFGFVGATRGAGETVYAVVAVALAWRGLGGMAPVLGQLASAVVKLGAYLAVVPLASWLTPHRLDRARIRAVFAFGAPLWLGSSAQFISRNWDNLLVGRLFGDRTMGLYKQAYNLADIPTAQVGEAIGDVLLPSFARVDDAAKARTLVRSTALLALIVFPLAVGLGVVAPTLVETIFNADWQGMAPFLTVLAGLSVARPVGWIVASYLQSRARVRAVMTLELGRAAAVLLSIVALAPLGALASAAGVGVAFGLHALASVWVVKRLDGISMAAMLGAMVGPLAACAIMAAAVLGVRAATGEAAPALALGLEIAGGAVAYVGACFVVARAATRDALGLLRGSFRTRREPAR